MQADLKNPKLLYIITQNKFIWLKILEDNQKEIIFNEENLDNLMCIK